MEQDIVRKAQQGDRDAMRVLYESSYQSLYKYIRFKVLNDSDAEDIVAEAFVRSFETINKFRNQSSFKTYVYAIARNLLKGYYNRKSIAEPLDDQMADELEEVENQEEDLNPKFTNLLTEVKECMNSLSSHEYEVVSLRFISGLTVMEVCSVLSMTESNVKVISHRAIKKLKEKLL